MTNSNVQVHIEPNLSCSFNKIDGGFCSIGGKIFVRVFMGIPLGIQPIVRLRIYENNMFTFTVHFETRCERNKT
jgi:hypothetical protein